MIYLIRLFKILLLPVMVLILIPIDLILAVGFYIKTGKLMDVFTGLFFRVYKP